MRHLHAPTPATRAASDSALDAQRCYQAMADKDAAWDGLFFTGVTSTGIYCRPVCRVKLPRQANCRFFETAVQAEAHGFRPCLRCRPELAPARRFWSTTDAQAVMAECAAQQLQSAIQQGIKPPSMASLAAQLGVSDRHLRRQFMRHWQVSPVQYLQTQRLLHAKQWLQDSPLSVAHVAHASGYGSARRLYAAFAQHYQLSPGQLRPVKAPLRKAPQPSKAVVLHYRPPCQIDTLWQFLKDRSLSGIESWEGQGPDAVLRRTVRWPHATSAITGWLELRWDRTQAGVHLRVSASLDPVLPQVVAQVRDWLDLDAEPARIAQIIGRDFPQALGQRLPGCMDGFELAVRAILGQQISVKAARTLGQRLVNALGEPCNTPWPELNRTFPSPETLAGEENAARMGSLGLVRQRQKAIQALARAVESGSLDLRPQTKLEPTLQALMALPGIGPWTAHYIAMRALRWLDAWPVQDVALQTALGVRQHPRPSQALEVLGQAWRPCRSYALIAAWQRLATHTEPSDHPKPHGHKAPAP
ncbi:Ada metal-binding domain-containing protein [Limnohabitans sp.]|jgi:AraC family transcriptional regulator of adaptative response / DNA-3-methyladenine glycosylase II|uniref:Ada metal-binding domain-containing protein n=1 Tax=Limnohabitans sp. TaxID=1907725 RepID=UPI0039BD5C2D|nr:helix-turn-helix domain-containing protein [Comamonadaceae bacterium]